MPAWERERGELPSPIWSLFDRKVGQGPYAYRNGVMGEPLAASTIHSRAPVPAHFALAVGLSPMEISPRTDLNGTCINTC